MTEPNRKPQLSIQIIPVTPFQQNCSLMWHNETKDAVFIDPGGDVEKLKAAAAQFEVNVSEIWLTHGHIDHAGGAAELAEHFGCKIIGPHRDDEWLLEGLAAQAAQYGIPGVRDCKPDQWLDEGDTVSLCGETFQVFYTPGHTPGHIIFYHEAGRFAFVGDVLFAGSIGRTDFPKSSHEDLINSIVTKLWPLGNDVRFIPGHNQMSTFGQERATNMFVADSVLGVPAK
ncbi:MAG: MBL fold metallo-hydrolase [Pseudomonadota bacterium]